jgi:hypothetical protein
LAPIHFDAVDDLVAAFIEDPTEGHGATSMSSGA